MKSCIMAIWPGTYVISNITYSLHLQEGLARLERSKRWDTRERKTALQNLEQFQEKAKKERLRIWQYGDVESDEDEQAPAARKPGGRR